MQPDSARVSISLVDPVVRATYNSSYPYGMNDGAMWAGRGSSAIVTAGGRARWGPVELRLLPSYTWSENQAFPLAFRFFAPANASPYADQWLSAGIDRPQRFGERAISEVGWGQSGISVTYRGAKIGYGTENMWWGPGVENALLLTNNAAGFPHAYIGTSSPADVRIGKLEVLYSVGWLKQSDYWRSPSDTLPDDRWTNSLAVVFEPRGAPGLYLGLGRVFMAYQRNNPITLRELSTVLQTFRKQSLATDSNPRGNDARDQMMSVWFRWVFPSVGFEAYGEYGKADHNWNWRDFFLEPDHARAYVLGINKVFSVRGGILSTGFETTNLATPRTANLRGAGFWYRHMRIQQGYTENGQTLGAGIGTGSDQQMFHADLYGSRGRIGVFARRHRHDSDSFYRAFQDPLGGQIFLHDATIGTGFKLSIPIRSTLIDFTYEAQNEFNRYTEHRNDVANHRIDLRVVVNVD